MPKTGTSGFASLYPAASVIPHSVSSPLVDKLTEYSQIFFNRLAAEKLGGVWTQPHYEVFESAPEQPPSYAGAMEKFEEFPRDGQGMPGAPRRPQAKAIFGWRFITCFAQMPTYLPWLYELFEAAGGEVIMGSLTAKEFLVLDADALVSCVGLHGDMFGDDPEKPCVIRGHLIKVYVDEYPANPISYNYHPPKEIYRDAKGDPADVYCYPRKIGGWALGGSRQEGEMRNGKWVGEDTIGPTLRISDIDVPEPIWTLNRELIQGLTGIDIDKFKRDASIGFRPVRTGNTSLRLEQSPLHKRLFHSGGQGGSGVTLSWGCAVELGHLIKKKLGIVFPGLPPFDTNQKNAKALNALQSLLAQF